MSQTFELMDGIPRLHLDEEHWASAVAESSLSIDDVGALAPLAGPSVELTNSDVLAAAALALTPAAIHFDVTTVSREAGVVASLGCDGQVSAGVVRAMSLSRDDQPTKLVPGVELSLVRVQHLVSEVVRLLPPDPPFSADVPDDVVALSHEDALVLSAAIKAGDDALARQIAREQGWDDVPEVLESLAHDVRGSASIAMRVAGGDKVAVWRWLQCDLGWVGVSIAGGQVTHAPCTRDDIAQGLLFAVSGAFDFALAGG